MKKKIIENTSGTMWCEKEVGPRLFRGTSQNIEVFCCCPMKQAMMRVLDDDLLWRAWSS